MTGFKEILLGAWFALAITGAAAAQEAAPADPIADTLPPAASEAVPTAPDAEDEEAAAATDDPEPEAAPAPAPAPASPSPQAANPPPSPPPPGEVLPAGPQPYSALYPNSAPPAATAGLPSGPQPYTALPRTGSTWTMPVRPAPQASNEPVHVDEHGKTTDRPLTYVDQGYDQRLRSSFASAQGLQGPLDGSWILAADGVGDVYVFELVDRGYGLVEGAWRDLRRKGALTGSGFIDVIERSGSQITLRFAARPDVAPTAATLTAGADGRWSGELIDQGQSRPATLRRN